MDSVISEDCCEERSNELLTPHSILTFSEISLKHCPRSLTLPKEGSFSFLRSFSRSYARQRAVSQPAACARRVQWSIGLEGPHQALTRPSRLRACSCVESESAYRERPSVRGPS